MSWAKRKRFIDREIEEAHPMFRDNILGILYFRALVDDQLDAIAYLLDKGVSVNVADYSRAITLTASCPGEKSLELLLCRGADPDFMFNGLNGTYLEQIVHRQPHIAYPSETKAAELLVRYGARIRREMFSGNPTLGGATALCREAYERRWTPGNHSLWALPVQRQLVTLLVIARARKSRRRPAYPISARIRDVPGDVLFYLFSVIADSFYK